MPRGKARLECDNQLIFNELDHPPPLINKKYKALIVRYLGISIFFCMILGERKKG